MEMDLPNGGFRSYSHLDDMEVPADDYDTVVSFRSTDDLAPEDIIDSDVVVQQGETLVEQNNAEEWENEAVVELPDEGILDEDTLAEGLSNLGRSADGTQQVFLRLTLPGCKLRDISLLQECVHLQKLELPYNDLAELSALNCTPNLVELDVSHNLLRYLLDFSPPKNLKYVNYSHNQIEDIGDLSNHHYLTTLVLDNNQISQIQGLDGCLRLTHLSLAHNKLTKMENLDNLPLQHLDMSHNQLQKIKNLETLRLLRTLNLAGNFIQSLNGLQDHDFLELVDLEGNEIVDLAELQHLKQLHLLRDVNLTRNPLRDLPDYRLAVLFSLSRLTQLDHVKVDFKEKAAASNMLNAPMEVTAARDHMMHVVYSFLQPSRILDSTLPSVETPYPLLVLCGPQGAGKKDLALKLVDEFPDYFGYGLSQTTRAPRPSESEGREYSFATIDEIETDVKLGRFVQTCSVNGQLFGLPLESIESVARDGLACVLHMELEGVLTLKNSHLEPRYVLVMPLSAAAHEARMRERSVYTDAQVHAALQRVDMYSEYNRNHPGFFDMMINSDDMTDAYRALRQLVLDYLGITPTPQSDTLGLSTNTSAFLLDKENTELTGVSPAGVRPWSKLSGADSGSQRGARPLRSKPAPATPLTAKSAVEEASIRRRRSAAKDAVSGHRPSLYEQLLRDAPKTTPYVAGAHLHGLEDTEDVTTKMLRRAYSAPAYDVLPPDSPDSSDIRSKTGSSSSLENPSVDRGSQSPVDSLELDNGRPGVEYEVVVEPLEIDSAGSKSDGPMAPRDAPFEEKVLSDPHIGPDSEAGTPRENSAVESPTARAASGGSRAGSANAEVQSAGGSRPTSRESELAGSRPVSRASRSGSALSASRPGSERHPVLPPISPKASQNPPDY